MTLKKKEIILREDWGHNKIARNKETKALNIINEITAIRDKVRQKLRFMLLVHNAHSKRKAIS